MIDNQQHIWFEQLHESQLQDWKTFSKEKYINVFNGVIDKYSDSAHFIYELLQNADDAGATEVEMVLEEDRFIFSHNGKIRFTVSNPKTEEEDKANGCLGHINSICAIGFSSKNFESEIKQNKIGKFGVGFKAVFQYTQTPEIYDTPFCFRIDNYIVPTAIESQEFQQQGKTVFVIPFNGKEVNSEKAFNEIAEKLQGIEYPQLFLNHIKTISWKTPETSNTITKTLEHSGNDHSVKYAAYSLSDLNNKKKALILRRSIKVAEHGEHDIAIGYFIDNFGRIITKDSYNINCFFPTNENIGTCYIIHAPFALVDNRQQIKRNNDVNQCLFKAITELAADSLLVLRDWKGYDNAKLLGDNIIKLIRYNTESFDKNNYHYKINNFFVSSYERIIEHAAIFLSHTGVYLTKKQSYWADDDTRKHLDDDQFNRLNQLAYRTNENYGFVLCSVNSVDLNASGVGVKRFEGELFAQNITSIFMKEQTNIWLARFYQYVIDKRLAEIYDLNKGQKTKAPMRYAKIVKVQTGDFVSAYNYNNEVQVYFPEEGITNANESVDTTLIDGCAPFRKFLETMEIKSPNQYDRFLIQIKKQKELTQEENNNLLISIINYYNNSEQEERAKFWNQICEKLSFVVEDINNGENFVWAKPDLIYKDSDLLKEYFKNSGLKSKYFIKRSYYAQAISELGESRFNLFFDNFRDIKVRPLFVREERYLSEYENCHKAHHRVNNKMVYMIEGLDYILSESKCNYLSKELSHYIWNLITEYSGQYDYFFDNNYSLYELYNKRNKQDWGVSTLVYIILNSKWLYIGDEIKSISDGIYKEDLIDNGYNCTDLLLSNLKIESAPNVRDAEAISGMSEETKKTFAIGQATERLGINSPEDLERKLSELEEYKRRERVEKEALRERQTRQERRRLEVDAFYDSPKRKGSVGVNANDFDAPNNDKARAKQAFQSDKTKNIDEILAGFEEKAQVQREEFEQIANLRDTISQSEKYSYEWLCSLMQLEVQTQGTQGAEGKKSIYISFDKLAPSSKSDKMLILSEPSRHIPLALEEMDEIPITFAFRNTKQETQPITQKLFFDSVSVKENCLIIKGNKKTAASIESIIENIALLSYAYIEANEPISILQEWQKRIEGIGLEPADSVKQNIRSDIEFIFGPPGTGKTTTLSNRICGLISNSETPRILVLAPTNKACDVLTRKLYEICDGDDTWIWRFEKTDDPYIEEEELVYKRNSKISSQKSVCVIATMARYAFDGFEEGLLRSLEWDYVFIDEASMIPLYEIIPVLYNSNCKQVIVSGDPFQIQPIVNIDIWKNENIYTMINLNDFVHPLTEPHQFKVTTLMTQYRSIPPIGELFSSYLYGGKLQHNRQLTEHRTLNMGLKENPLNIITFPVGRESILDLKRLAKSNIHIYSVIFATEFIKYIARNINENHANDENKIRIGVVSPYSAEIQAINKIYSQSCPMYDNIDVIFGSAHGFQGDQCDIVIAVMNPPASGLKRAADMTFINNRNIMNVAISRASDYLFILIPDKAYENFHSLYEIKDIGKKILSLLGSTYTSDEIELDMFGKRGYIEDNTYVTSHKMTNVFSDPFAKYEIRIDENAIDIQINDDI